MTQVLPLVAPPLHFLGGAGPRSLFSGHLCPQLGSRGFAGRFSPRRASLVAQMVKCLPAMWETWVESLGWEDPPEEGMVTFFPGESHGQRSLVGCSPWGR